MEKVEVKAILDKYLELDKEIAKLESNNVRKKYQEIKSQMDDVAITLKQLEGNYEKKKEKTAKEKADVDEIAENFKKLGQSDDDKMKKEMAEYMEAMSEQQALQQQITGVKDQIDVFEKRLKEFSGDKEKLDKAQKEQDELLDKVFKGNYGSDKENELEQKLENLLERQQLIKAAHDRWINGQVLVTHGLNQLGFSASKWLEVDCSKWDKNDIYKAVTDVRNNLIAASTNLKNAQSYLSNIDFPYCKKEELKTLDDASHNVYVDIQSKNRQNHAGQCFKITHKRCEALCQWFKQVIDERIKVDLQEANKAVRETSKELRQERIRLMQELADDKQDIQVQEYDNFKDEDEKPNVIGLVQTEEGDKMEQNQEQKQLPKSKLAAAPTEQDLFGNVEELKQQFIKQEADSKKTQEFNKARVQQGLDEKLTARRNRRNRNKEAQS